MTRRVDVSTYGGITARFTVDEDGDVGIEFGESGALFFVHPTTLREALRDLGVLPEVHSEPAGPTPASLDVELTVLKGRVGELERMVARAVGRGRM